MKIRHELRRPFYGLTTILRTTTARDSAMTRKIERQLNGFDDRSTGSTTDLWVRRQIYGFDDSQTGSKFDNKDADSTTAMQIRQQALLHNNSTNHVRMD